MKIPKNLYRYRPLPQQEKNSALLERELDALRNSYLFAPSFSSMNDPMEAFYETGDQLEHLLASALPEFGKLASKIYEMIEQQIHEFGLISFSQSQSELPLWAYYASNFCGMCLEFEVEGFEIGDLGNEPLHQVRYFSGTPNPVTLRDLSNERLKEVGIACLTRKRIEWAHEKEWRYLTGSVGRRHYIDEALTRVFIGPRTEKAHTKAICDTLKNRRVEILQGEIRGFELRFHSIQAAAKPPHLERIGVGKIEPEAYSHAEDELKDVLQVPFERFVDVYNNVATRPNFESFAYAGITESRTKIYVWEQYKLRSGTVVLHKQLYDFGMNPFDIRIES